MNRRDELLALADDCDRHTVCPDGYTQWHAWAEQMNKTHEQRRCNGCGLYAIWEPRALAQETPDD